jgi:hypothetical protein
MPISRVGNNLRYAADVTNTKYGIEGYFWHVVKSNNVNGTMRIRTSLYIGKLKRTRTAFRLYLDSKRVYINKAQLRTEEGLSGFTNPTHHSHFEMARRSRYKR